jgi:hypothetical protein
VKPIGQDGDLGSSDLGEHGTIAPSNAPYEFMDDELGIELFPTEVPPLDETTAVSSHPEAPAGLETSPLPELPLPLVAAPATPAVATAPPPDTPLHFDIDLGSPGRLRTPALSIADLLDNHVRLEWQEAVAIALHLCGLMSKEPGASVHRSLVEPWNVEITNAGEVHVLPGGSSSDPLVKQVGRVLRALLQDSIAPAELRLVASQASFDVPVYSSVDELSAALTRFDRTGRPDAIRSAFNRGLEAKFAIPAAPEPAASVVRSMPVVPVAQVKRSALKTPAPRVTGDGRYPSRMSLLGGVAGVVAVAVAWLAVSRVPEIPQLSSFGSTPAPTPVSEERAVQAPLQVPPPSELRETAPDKRPVTPPIPKHEVAAGRATPPSSRGASISSSRPVSESASLTAPRIQDPVQRTVPGGDSLEAAERRAAALLAEGRAGEATVIFDGIVMKNPLYQPDPARSTPEALAAFQTSKRLLLPAMARRYYQEARVAYDAGDFSMVLTKGERALALLRDAEIDPPESSLSSDVTDLIALATSARTLEESRIYSSADRDVTPPRPVGRQLSVASLSGRTPLTGRLELVVGVTGEVETVKLETPLNGYHDRMIVSAAKAWHYRPGLRKGRPVRYRMIMSITLPDF